MLFLQNQGRIITFESDPGMADRARVNITEAGMSGFIEVRCQDVYDDLATLAHSVDMVFMDTKQPPTEAD